MSSPDPPNMVSPFPSPAVETMMISAPAPPFISSLPPLPSIVSTPSPPLIVSVFPLPFKVSSPDRPVNVYAPVIELPISISPPPVAVLKFATPSLVVALVATKAEISTASAGAPELTIKISFVVKSVIVSVPPSTLKVSAPSPPVI